MAAITTRSTAGTGATVAGVPLTNAQLDTNFINLNTAVVDAAANTAVTAGAYTNTNLTVDARGRITAATNGSPGGVTAVTGTTPVVSSGGTTPAISMAQATTSVSGYLSSTDWTTFNNKLGSYTETDTLATVTARGATTTVVPTFSNGAVIQGLTIGKGIGGYSTNTALGVSTLNTAGVSQYNTAVGYQTLTNNSTGSFNTAVGGSAITGYSTGSYNSALGYQALTSITSGTSNIGIGYFAGYSIDTGSNNTIIGSVAGTAGLSNTVIIAAGATERMRIDSSGNVGIGGTGTAGVNLDIRKVLTGAALAYGVNVQAAIQSDVTASSLFQTYPSTAAVAFTLTNLRHYDADQGTIGVGSTVTNQYGFRANSTLTGATNNYGFFGNIASGTGRYNLYMAGTAANYLGGNLQVAGDTTLAAYTETIVASNTVGASATLAITAGTVLTATLTSATPCTFTMPTAIAGKSFTLLLKQPASGTATTATFTNVKWSGSGAPTITATIGKMDILTFVADGTNWYGSYTQGYTP